MQLHAESTQFRLRSALQGAVATFIQTFCPPEIGSPAPANEVISFCEQAATRQMFNTSVQPETPGSELNDPPTICVVAVPWPTFKDRADRSPRTPGEPSFYILFVLPCIASDRPRDRLAKRRVIKLRGVFRPTQGPMSAEAR
jgi:hypothetical protein